MAITSIMPLQCSDDRNRPNYKLACYGVAISGCYLLFAAAARAQTPTTAAVPVNDTTPAADELDRRDAPSHDATVRTLPERTVITSTATAAAPPAPSTPAQTLTQDAQIQIAQQIVPIPYLSRR